MHYTIKTCSDDPHVIQERRRNAEARLRQWFNLPHGVSIHEMAEVWQQMDFGDTTSETQPPFDPQHFRKAGPSVRELRRLAKRGRKLLQAVDRQQEGKGVVILGQGGDSPRGLSDGQSG